MPCVQRVHIGSVRLHTGHGSLNFKPQGAAPVPVSTRCFWPLADTHTVFLADVATASW